MVDSIPIPKNQAKKEAQNGRKAASDSREDDNINKTIKYMPKSLP